MSNPLKNGLRALVRRHRQRLGKTRAADVRSVLRSDSIVLLDVGASGGIIPRWQPYRESVAFIGIEPDERSVPELLATPDAKIFKSYDIIPSGAWNRSGTLNISFTRKPMCSSHFQPNIAFLSRFLQADRFEVVGSGDIQCHTVDQLLSGRPVDFIKLDLEGGELAVLEGATTTIESCLGLHVEVSFQLMRREQPLFGDVASFLQRRGIEFVDFVHLCRWERKSFEGLGQAIFADALFLRGPESLIDPQAGRILDARTARVYLAILLIYERFDLAVRFLELVRKTGPAVLERAEISSFQSLFGRRKAIFDRRYRVVAAIGRVLSRYAGDNYGLHYIY